MKKKLIFIAFIMFSLIGIISIFTFRVSNLSKKQANEVTVDAAEILIRTAEGLEKEDKLLDARRRYQKLLNEYPASSLVKDARTRLDELNIRLLFSPVATEDCKFYEVQQGDTLFKIAKNFGTTVELIMKSNNLVNDIIRPGMRLKISNAKYSILVDKSQNILMLKSNDEVLKTYTVSTAAIDNQTPSGTYKINTKLVNPPWHKPGAAVIPPGDPENILGTRWLGFDLAGYGIHGTTDDSSIGKHITAGCVRMKNADVEELYAIVPVGTEVTIID